VSSLELTLTFTNDPGADTVAEIVQANLAEIGINVKLDKVEGAAFYELGRQLRERELTYAGYITQPDPSWSTVWFICDQFDQWNWIYWCSEEFDRIHFAALQEPDQAKRQEMYLQMQQIWDEAANMVWVAWPTRHFAFKKGLKPALTPHGRVLPHAFRSA
jgi:peptide/nickel transport system substrate-binding protein